MTVYMLTDSARNKDCTFCYESYFGEQMLTTEDAKWEQSGSCKRADTLARYPTARYSLCEVAASPGVLVVLFLALNCLWQQLFHSFNLET